MEITDYNAVNLYDATAKIPLTPDGSTRGNSILVQSSSRATSKIPLTPDGSSRGNSILVQSSSRVFSYLPKISPKYNLPGRSANADGNIGGTILVNGVPVSYALVSAYFGQSATLIGQSFTDVDGNYLIPGQDPQYVRGYYVTVRLPGSKVGDPTYMVDQQSAVLVFTG